jgi:hypothetical protein
MNGWATVWPLILALAGMIGFHLASIRQPLSQEELTWWFQLPQGILATGRPLTIYGTAWNDHPPLYALLLAAVFAGFGVGEVQARALGLALGLLTMVTFYRTVCILQDRHAREVPLAPLALGLYALHPLVLQSTLLIEADTTLGPLATGLLALYAVHLGKLGARQEAALGGLLVAFLLWIKIYDAVLLIAVLVLVVALHDGWRAALPRVGRVVTVGLVLFALTWIPLSHALSMDATRPMAYVFDALRHRSLDAPLNRPREAAEAALWISPVLMVVAPLIAVAWLRRGHRRPQLLGVQLIAVWGVAQLIVPLFFIGTLYGFPKYQAPALVLLLPALTLYMATRVDAPLRSLWLAAVLGAVSGVLLYPVVGDVLLEARVHLKAVALRQPDRVWQAAGVLVLSVMAYLVLPAVVLCCWPGRHRRWRNLAVPALLAAHVSLMAGLVTAQTRAGYLTRYAYGEQGVRAVADLIRHEAAQGLVVALLPVTHYAGAPPLPSLSTFWDRGALTVLPAVRDPGTCCLVYSLAHNSLAQLRYLEHDRTLATALRDHGFAKRTIGTFTVWYRQRQGIAR